MASLNTAIDWQLGKSLGESLLYLYENKLWTDVSFRCKDHNVDDKDDRIRAHRAILAARSPVFQKMLYVYDTISGDKEDQELPTVEAEIFHLIVKYMYRDTTELTEDVAVRVMETAHMYQIQGLVQYCANYLKTILRVENACEILELALFYETEGLRDAACNFIDGNAAAVLRSDKFLDISETCLTYILQGDTFDAEEKDIVTMVDRWAERRLVGHSDIPEDKSEKMAIFKSVSAAIATFLFCACVAQRQKFAYEQALTGNGFNGGNGLNGGNGGQKTFMNGEQPIPYVNGGQNLVNGLPAIFVESQVPDCPLEIHPDTATMFIMRSPLGDPEPRTCPSGTYFLRSACSCVHMPLDKCNRRPSAMGAGWYDEEVFGVWMRRPCGPGSAFNAITCYCSDRL